MRVEKTTKFKKRISFMDHIQYFIGLFISILFLVGFIPFSFDNLFKLIIGLIIIQVIISLLRLRIFNILLELILLGLAIFSLIPVLGYFFRFLGFIVGILEMTSFKNYKLYKKVEITRFYPKKFKKKQIKNKVKFKDAEFKEK